MKLKNFLSDGTQSSLHKLTTAKHPAWMAFRLAKLELWMRDVSDTFVAARKKSIEEFAAKGEDGQVLTTDKGFPLFDKPNEASFNKEIEQLLEEEVTFGKKFNLKDLVAAELTAFDIANLMDIISDEEPAAEEK